MSDVSSEEMRTIRQTNALIRSIVEVEMLEHPFWIGGIVTRHYLSDRGHVYFDLYDDDFSISCFLREPTRATLDFTLNNGMDVEVFGTVKVYDRQARVQMEAEKIRLIERPVFVIDKSVQERLEKQGLWPKVKKPLPDTISNIGLITSKHSDARSDFFDTYYREGGKATITPVDVRVQGQQAPGQIVDAINRLNAQREVDVIALVRGGGRVADLAVFDDYLIAEAICRSSIPIVTGIGHQQDDSFADQVADVKTITPTAAASFLAKGRLDEDKPAQTKETEHSPNRYLMVMLALAVIIIAVLAVVILTGQTA
jgi:exodeoxyribonuclease VII large subunit